MMRAGALRQLLTVQRKVQVGVTELNEPNLVWQDFLVDIPCEATVRRGREHFDPATKQRYSEDVWLFRVRYDEIVGLDATMRVIHDSKTFDIRSPRPDAQFGYECVVECTVQDVVLGSAPLSISIVEFIPDGQANVAYAGFMVTATGGTAPYTFAEESGSLPQGLALNPSTGAVSGIPLVAGMTAGIDIQVTDSVGAIAVLPAFSITIAA